MVITPMRLRIFGFVLLVIAFAIAIVGTTPEQACLALGTMVVGAAVASNAWQIATLISELVDNMAISIR